MCGRLRRAAQRTDASSELRDEASPAPQPTRNTQRPPADQAQPSPALGAHFEVPPRRQGPAPASGTAAAPTSAVLTGIVTAGDGPAAPSSSPTSSSSSPEHPGHDEEEAEHQHHRDHRLLHRRQHHGGRRPPANEPPARREGEAPARPPLSPPGRTAPPSAGAGAPGGSLRENVLEEAGVPQARPRRPRA